MLGRDLGFEILASAAVGANELVAIASNAVVSAVDPVPTSMQAPPRYCTGQFGNGDQQ
jgi:hypothetical protein